MRVCLLCLFLCTLARADTRVWVGSFTQGATTVTTSDGGGSFQPKAFIITGTSNTSVGSLAGARQSWGFSSSNGPSRGATWAEANDTNGSTASTVNKRQTSNDRAVVFYEGTTLVGAAEITYTSTGITMVWSTNDATARIWNCWALGGTDITDSKVGIITSPTSGGGTVTATVGFAPTMIFFAGGAVTPATWTTAPSTSMVIWLGQALGTSTTTAGGVGIDSTNAVATSTAGSVEVSKSIQISSSSTSTFTSCDVTSSNGTSYTITCGTAGATAVGSVYLAIAGGNWASGRANQRTTTGDTVLTTTGVHPTGAIFFSANKATSSSYSVNARGSFGATDGTHNFSTFLSQKNGVTAQVASTSMDQTNVLRMMTAAGASPTVDATADTVTFADNSLTLHWSAVDATAREYVWIAAGNAVSGGGSTAVPHRVNQ